MEYEIAVKMAELNSAIVRSNLAGDLAAAEVQGFSQVPADAFFVEINGVRTLIDSWCRRYDHPTRELDEIVKSLDTLVQETRDTWNILAAKDSNTGNTSALYGVAPNRGASNIRALFPGAGHRGILLDQSHLD